LPLAAGPSARHLSRKSEYRKRHQRSRRPIRRCSLARPFQKAARPFRFSWMNAQELLANTEWQIAEYNKHVAEQEAKIAELSAKVHRLKTRWTCSSNSKRCSALRRRSATISFASCAANPIDGAGARGRAAPKTCSRHRKLLCWNPSLMATSALTLSRFDVPHSLS
jgi:hypothetical protein